MLGGAIKAINWSTLNGWWFLVMFSGAISVLFALAKGWDSAKAFWDREKSQIFTAIGGNDTNRKMGDDALEIRISRLTDRVAQLEAMASSTAPSQPLPQSASASEA
jgi:hypothetical protein